MVLKHFGSIIQQTDQYSTKSHRRFAIMLTALIKIVVSSVTPAAFLTFLYLTYNYNENFELLNATVWKSPQWCLVKATVWSLLEIGFYLYCLNLQRIFSKTTSLQSNWVERLFHLERVLYHNPTVFKSLSKWFHERDQSKEENDIQLEHIEEWLSWAFFSNLKRNLSHEDLNELNWIVEKCLEIDPTLVRNKNTRTTATGHYKSLKFMKLNLDPIRFQHKPLIAYLIISLIQLYGSLFLYSIGFKHHNCQPSSTLSYWIYNSHARSKQDQNGNVRISGYETKPPVFLVYGIGMGVAMYLKVINAIRIKDPDRTIVVFNQPHISLKLVHQIPSMLQTLEAIDNIFKRHELTSCNWLGHSYGAIATAWVIKIRPSYVNKVTLVDPICFALWEPDLIYNFLYNSKPTGPIHHLAQYFGAKDLLVATTLFRHFWWMQNILFPEDLRCPTHVYLSQHDWIIDSHGIRKYLDNFCVQNPSIQLSTTMLDNAAHGGFISSDDMLQVVLKHV